MTLNPFEIVAETLSEKLGDGTEDFLGICCNNNNNNNNLKKHVFFRECVDEMSVG